MDGNLVFGEIKHYKYMNVVVDKRITYIGTLECNVVPNALTEPKCFLVWAYRPRNNLKSGCPLLGQQLVVIKQEH